MPGIEVWGELQTLVPVAFTLVFAGLIAGGLGGLFGVGGGAVLVPVLYQLYGLIGIDEAVRMQLAVGTSLGIIVPTSIRSFTSHLSHDAVNMAYLRVIAVWVLLGVFAGSLAAAYVSGATLRGVFAAMACLMGLNMLFGKKSWRLGEELPKPPMLQGVGGGIGFFSVLMGVGGGVFNNLVMTLYGHTIHRAVATSSGIGVLISIPGALGFIWAGWGRPELPDYSLGFISLLGVALVIPTSLLAVPFGARLAHSLPKEKLKIWFAIFLLLVSARFFISLV